MSATERLSEYIGQVGEDVLRNDQLRVLLPAVVGVFLVGELYRQALPLYFEAVGIPLSFLGLVLGIGNAVQIGLSPVTGAVADRVDRLPLAGLAAVGMAVLLAAFALRPGQLVVAVLIVLAAVPWLVMNNALTPAVNAALEDGVEGIGWGVRDVGLYAGSAAGLAVGGVVLARTARVELVFLLGVPVLLGVGALAWTSRSGAALEGGLTDLLRSLFERFRFDRSLFDRPRFIAGVREQLRSVSDPQLLYLFCLVELTTTVGIGMTMFLLPALATDIGIAASGYLFLYSASRLFGAPASVVGGVAADQLPTKWLFVTNYAVEGVMLLVFALADGPLLFLVGMGLFVVQTVFEPAVVAYFFEHFEDEEGGTVWGIKGGVHRLGNVVAPVVGGALYAIEPHYAFLVGGGFMLAGAAVAATLPQ